MVKDLYGSVKSAQKKIHNMVSESEQEENTDKLLNMNDLINSVVDKYEKFKQGLLDAKSAIDLRRFKRSLILTKEMTM